MAGEKRPLKVLEGAELEDWSVEASGPQTRTLAECCYRVLRHRTETLGQGVGVNLSGMAETLTIIHRELVDLGLILEG